MVPKAGRGVWYCVLLTMPLLRTGSLPYIGRMIDIQIFRQARRALPLPGYNLIEISPNHLAPGFRASLDRQLTGRYGLGNQFIDSLDPPLPWTAHGASFAFHMNAWNPVSPYLLGFSRYGEDAYFRKAWAFARCWLEEFQRPAFAIGTDPKALEAAQGPSAWYDMAVGHRAYRIAYLLDVIARDSAFQDDEVELLYRAMVFHLRLLARADFFKTGHNHGFYQAMGEIAALRRFEAEPIAQERLQPAIARLQTTIADQFHQSGVHREHSPGYHFMVLFTLLGARKSGLLSGIGLDEALNRQEEAFSWMISPGGEIATIGDSDQRSFRGDNPVRQVFNHPWLKWQMSDGQEGTAPPSGVRADIESGWVFARSEADRKDWWYFAQIASFFSRTHKHADDLSFVWSDRGADILMDPARYGYVGGNNPANALKSLGFNYADPNRIYIEQTRAHNTVEIDGLAQDRRREPQGSALVGASMTGGLMVSETQVCFSPLLGHWRCIVLRPGRFLLVVDWLSGRLKQRHDYRQYFHFAPEWLADPAGEGMLMRRAGLALSVLPLAPGQAGFTSARGAEEPQKLGWYAQRAYKMQPCTSICCERLDDSQTVFATLFTFGGNAQPAASEVRAKLRDAQFSWQEDGIPHTVRLSRPCNGGNLMVALEQGR